MESFKEFFKESSLVDIPNVFFFSILKNETCLPSFKLRVL
jgi:hypothetical protein